MDSKQKRMASCTALENLVSNCKMGFEGAEPAGLIRAMKRVLRWRWERFGQANATAAEQDITYVAVSLTSITEIRPVHKCFNAPRIDSESQVKKTSMDQVRDHGGEVACCWTWMGGGQSLSELVTNRREIILRAMVIDTGSYPALSRSHLASISGVWEHQRPSAFD